MYIQGQCHGTKVLEPWAGHLMALLFSKGTTKIVKTKEPLTKWTMKMPEGMSNT